MIKKLCVLSLLILSNTVNASNDTSIKNDKSLKKWCVKNFSSMDDINAPGKCDGYIMPAARTIYRTTKVLQTYDDTKAKEYLSALASNNFSTTYSLTLLSITYEASYGLVN